MTGDDGLRRALEAHHKKWIHIYPRSVALIELGEILRDETLAEHPPGGWVSVKERPDDKIAVLLEVNRRAEAAMLRGEQITGAHHRAIDAILEELRLPEPPRDGEEK